MWRIMFNKQGDKVVLEGDNPIYYLCERFLTCDEYTKNSITSVDEIVSMDTLLFPVNERFLLVEEDFTTKVIPTNEQLLRVQYIDETYCEVDEFVAGFDFCGYDLVDESEISAITNCGRLFEKTITCNDLNSFGLISNLSSARKIQVNLKANHPDEDHAGCLLFGIWRRVK